MIIAPIIPPEIILDFFTSASDIGFKLNTRTNKLKLKNIPPGNINKPNQLLVTRATITAPQNNTSKDRASDARPHPET